MEMISWERFNRLISGRYLFHIHTDYTDGDLGVHEYFSYADKNNISTIIFTEHVRKRLNYNFDDFLLEIKKNNKYFPGIRAITGIECKILPSGKLDVRDEIANKVNIIGIACHSFPGDGQLYLKSMKEVIDSSFSDKIRVWLHPGLFFLKYSQFQKDDLFFDQFKGLVHLANQKRIFGEINKKYELPNAIFDEKMFKYKIFGADAHNLDELHKYHKLERRY